MEQIQPRKVRRTGRVVQHPKGSLHEVTCDACQMDQWHPVGIVRCVFCDARLSIAPFELVKNDDVEPPVILPEES